MTPRNMINLSPTGLRRMYAEKLPRIFRAAAECGQAERFVAALGRMIAERKILSAAPEMQEAAGHLALMISYEGKTIHELSRDQQMHIETLTDLWLFLRDELPDKVQTDLFLDLYYLLLQIENPEAETSGAQEVLSIKTAMKRWPGGLDEPIIRMRERNKERIVELLISKIEQRHSPASRYVFQEGMSHEQKKQQVLEWWQDYRFHLSAAIKSPTELNLFLDNTLSKETVRLLSRGKKKGMPFFITPYYLSLLNTEADGFDDSTIRSYVLYSEPLIDTYGHIRAWEREDVVEAGKPNAAGWLVPGHNIHRRYPDVAIMIPDSMGRACGGLCAVCQRMYDFQSERLNFDFMELKPKETWDKKLARLMEYFENDPQLQDILVTGGDALMSQNQTLRKILEAIRRMARRKRIANRNRPDGQKYAELQRVRLGSRLLAYLPVRVNDELVAILKEFREKAMEAGIKQFIIQTHFQSPLEVTPEALRAIRAIRSAGWTITNQLVFTVAASRRGHTAQLRRVLNQAGVVCYYTFSVKGFEENYALYAPISRSMQESAEEKSFGVLSDTQTQELVSLLVSESTTTGLLSRFLRKHGLPFVATDRNVLNLPGIGKSMSFETVGITPDGKRILRFDHDRSRRHSPIIDRMGEVYIVENKSIAAYLRELKTMGENPERYKSIWEYRSGRTEPRFKLFEYPDFPFRTTAEMENIRIEIAEGPENVPA